MHLFPVHLWLIIALCMERAYEIKKYSADKIALLGLFIIALLMARLITASRSAVVLSEPIKLDYAGLSVSMPAGNGWRGEKQWQYRKNAFILKSVFNPGSGTIGASAYCRYILAAGSREPQIRFEEMASAIDGEIIKTDQIRTDILTIDWAHIRQPRTLASKFFGTVRLSDNRQLDIEVSQITGDIDSAERVFKRISESLKFEDNQLLETGSEIIAEIKRAGIDSFLYNANRQASFLITNSRGRPVGCTMDVLIDSGSDAQLNIRAASFLYIRDRHAREQVELFQSDNSFGEFTWKSETSTSSITGRIGTEIILDEEGLMTVRKFGLQREEGNYKPSNVAIPGVLLELAFSQMLDSDYKKIILDEIEADGTIIPTLISRIDTEDTDVVEEEAAYVLKVEFFKNRRFSEHVYLDNKKRIIKRVPQQQGIYIIASASVEDILRRFPEQADYILQRKELLEQKQPQF